MIWLRRTAVIVLAVAALQGVFMAGPTAGPPTIDPGCSRDDIEERAPLC